jgi:hypothetical protein
MMDIERELRDALKREKPSAGFTQRVMNQCATAPVRVQPRRMWRALAAAAVLSAIVGGWTVRAVAERRAGERARDEVLIALRITSDKLQDARSHVRELGEKP